MFFDFIFTLLLNNKKAYHPNLKYKKLKLNKSESIFYKNEPFYDILNHISIK